MQRSGRPSSGYWAARKARQRERRDLGLTAGPGGVVQGDGGEMTYINKKAHELMQAAGGVDHNLDGPAAIQLARMAREFIMRSEIQAALQQATQQQTDRASLFVECATRLARAMVANVEPDRLGKWAAAQARVIVDAAYAPPKEEKA